MITLFFTLPYPLEPAQLSLISVLTIGIPSFVLALEPNKSLVRGHFMQNVLYRSLPAAFTNLFMVIGVLLFYLAFDIPKDEMSTICAVIMGIVGMLMLFTTSMPFNTIRRILFISMGALHYSRAYNARFLLARSPHLPDRADPRCICTDVNTVIHRHIPPDFDDGERFQSA